MADEISRPTDPDVLQVIQDFKTCSTKQASAKVKELVENLTRITINIAVTGESGSGKSFFVNALRGLSVNDKGAAETGVTETTMEPKRYTHPDMPNVHIWDLPGIGSTNFKAKEYLKKVMFETFDFFLIVSSTRFKDNDIMLANEIKRMNKLFYFVRSKIDNDEAYEQEKKKNFNREEMLTKIRKDCKTNLQKLGDEKVFLISAKYLERYDFQKLVEALLGNLDSAIGSSLIQSLPVCSLEMIKKKQKMLMRMIWLNCFSSSAVAMLPIPGLSVAVDVALLVSFYTSCYHIFGLNERSLRMLSTKSGVQVSELKDKMKSIFADGITTELVMSFVACKGVATAVTLEYFLSFIPAFGTLAAGGVSFATTYILLKRGMDEMAEAAERLLQAAGVA